MSRITLGDEPHEMTVGPEMSNDEAEVVAAWLKKAWPDLLRFFNRQFIRTVEEQMKENG